MITGNGKAERLPTETEDPIIKHLEECLAEFLRTNPSSKIAKIEGDPDYYVIAEPWGDNSLNIRVDPSSTEFINALNCVHLPERLIAIWHRKTKSLEIIFTAFPLPPTLEDITTRNFTFNYR